MSLEYPQVTAQETIARDFLIKALGREYDPISITNIYKRSKDEGVDTSQEELRRATWYLIDKGEIKFTPNRLLIRAEQPV